MDAEIKKEMAALVKQAVQILNKKREVRTSPEGAAIAMYIMAIDSVLTYGAQKTDAQIERILYGVGGDNENF
jgi:hypothetical protein